MTEFIHVRLSLKFRKSALVRPVESGVLSSLLPESHPSLTVPRCSRKQGPAKPRSEAQRGNICETDASRWTLREMQRMS
jgi:hypothetical protein